MTPLKATDVTSVNPVPLMVTADPTAPLGGKNSVMEREMGQAVSSV
jgi:hypothetical protein